MQTAARLGRAALPVVGAGVASVVSSGPAHADAPAAALDIPFRRITDGWELADLKDQSVVLFTSADIDSAVGLLTRPTQTAAIEELDSSDCSSDSTVDEVIERSSYHVAEASSSSFGFDASLFTVAARLLKSPGVQGEIVKAALSDPEVFEILAGKMDLPNYLEMQGLAARGLLTNTDAADADTLQQAEQEVSAGQDSSSSVFDDVSAWAADRVEDLGHAVVRLGRWMRGKLGAGEEQQEIAKASSGSAAGAAGGDSAYMRRVGGGTLAAVMVAMVAIIGVVLLRKPAAFRGLARAMSRASKTVRT